MFDATSRSLLLIAAGLLAMGMPSKIVAHSDPWGEIHPQLAVQGGKFFMTFYRLEPGERESRRVDFRVIYFPDGTVAVPRHVIGPAQTPEHHYFVNSNHPHRVVELTGNNDAPEKRLMVLRDTSSQPAIETPLAVDCKNFVHVQNSTFAKAGIGLVVNARPSPRDFTCILTLVHLDAQSFMEKGRVALGECPTVYHFPEASEAVWAGNRWWIAWIGPTELTKRKFVPSAEFNASLTLTSYDPVSGKVHHKWLSSELNSDCRPSLKTVGGWLGIAWHASRSIEGKSRARVLVAFEKLP